MKKYLIPFFILFNGCVSDTPNHVYKDKILVIHGFYKNCYGSVISYFPHLQQYSVKFENCDHLLIFINISDMESYNKD